jgi:hypothetical protein
MANKTLVTVVQGGKFIREYRYDALMGAFFDRLERAHGVVELRDPDLELKGFTKDEISDLRNRFGMVDLDDLPKEPEPFDFNFRGEPTKEVVESKEVIEESEPSLDSLSKKELSAYLKDKGVEFDGRANKETLLELAKK